MIEQAAAADDTRLAHQIALYGLERGRSNAMHIKRLAKLAKDPSFTGNVRLGQTSGKHQILIWAFWVLWKIPKGSQRTQNPSHPSKERSFHLCYLSKDIFFLLKYLKFFPITQMIFKSIYLIKPIIYYTIYEGYHRQRNNCNSYTYICLIRQWLRTPSAKDDECGTLREDAEKDTERRYQERVMSREDGAERGQRRERKMPRENGADSERRRRCHWE